MREACCFRKEQTLILCISFCTLCSHNETLVDICQIGHRGTDSVSSLGEISRVFFQYNVVLYSVFACRNWQRAALSRDCLEWESERCCAFSASGDL